jgi:ParB family transcriptional regulator, chromosome partitioning protein
MSTRQKGLGRGLAALLGSDQPETTSVMPASATNASPLTLPLAQVVAGRYQPRTRMDETALNELAQSITLHGPSWSVLLPKTPCLSRQWAPTSKFSRGTRS